MCVMKKEFKCVVTTGMLGMMLLAFVFLATGVMAAGENTNVEDIGVAYRGHVENYGNMPKPEGSLVAGPSELGTRGQGLRVEGFWIELTGNVPEGANIVYEVHVQNEGWMTPVKNGNFAGTAGKSQRVESIKINLENMPGYDVYYRGHVQNVGNTPLVDGEWGWKKNGEELGTTGSSQRLEELQVKIVKQPDTTTTYDKAGTYGPETGVETIDNDVVINTPDVVLQNLHIKGNLTIGEGVGEGDVTLNNITVDGETYIRGGGKNSIHINGGDYNKITIQQTSSGQVRIVATNAEGLEVVISENAKGESIILEGKFENVQVDAPDVKISTQGDTAIKQMNLGETAKGSEVTLDADTKVENLVLDAEVDVKGQGTVEKAKVNSDGVTFEKAPEKQDVSPEVETPPVVTPPEEKPPVTPPVTPTPGGGGTPTTTAITGVSIIGDQNVGSTLTATPNPTNATGAYQWMRSTTVTGTYEAITGATSKTYVLQSGDATKYIKVVITGNGNYTGTQTSVATSAITNLKEITAFTPLTTITISSNENLTDLASLKASGKLPTQVTVTDGTTPASATITNWIGTFDGTTTGAKTLTAVWTMPTGYRDQTTPITVQITVNVNTAQTAVSSSDKVITSTTIGTLDAGNITAVPVGTKVKTLKDGLTLSPYATCEITASSDPGALAVTDPENTNVTGTMVIKVTAQDNSIATYTITMVPVVKSTTPTANTTIVAKTVQTQATADFTLTSNHSGGTWKVFSNADCTTAATGVSAALSGTILTLTHATDLPTATYYVVYNDGTRTDSDALVLTVSAYSEEPTAVSAVTAPTLVALNGDLQINFDEPSDLTGINRIQMLVSCNDGQTWATATTALVADDPYFSSDCLSLSLTRISYRLEGMTTINKIKVISVAETGYLVSSFEMPCSLTINKADQALPIIATYNNGAVQAIMTAVKQEGETYFCQLKRANGTLITEYMMGEPNWINSTTAEFRSTNTPYPADARIQIVKGSDATVTNTSTGSVNVTPLQAGGVMFTDITPVKSTTPTADTTTVAKTAQTQTSVGFILTSIHTDGTWKVYNDQTCTTEAVGVTVTFSGTTVTLTHATDLPAATYYVVYKNGTNMDSDALALTVGAYEEDENLVGVVKNARFEVLNGTSILYFDQPTDKIGIQNYQIMFSSDNGQTWDYTAQPAITNEATISIDMSALAINLNETKAFNKVKVISDVAENSDYQKNEASFTIDFTLTKAGSELAIAVARNELNNVEISLPENATADEIYAVRIFGSSGVGSSSTVIFKGSQITDNIITMYHTTQPISGISEGAIFKVCKINNCTTTGLSVTPMQATGVTINSTPPTLSSEKAITATTVGTLTVGNITGVPVGTKVSVLKSGLTVSENATAEIITGTGGSAVADQTNTDVTPDMKIEVTAQDNSKAEYTITMAPSLDAPANLVADAGSELITLTWDAATDAQSYTIYRSTTIGTDYTEIANGVTNTTYQAIGLIPGQTYYFVIKAVAVGYNDSAESSEVSAIANVDLSGSVYSGNKLVVTNESLNLTTQSTGTLSNITMDSQIIDGLDQGAYRINPEIPVTQSPGEPLVNSSMESNMVVANVNDERSFYTYSYETQQYVTITARCAYLGTHSEIWVDKNEAAGTALTAEEAQTLATEFDENIYGLITTNFYAAPDVNNDSKVAILVYDIQDGYTGSGGYVGGYFNGNDLYNGANSNQLDMIYVDTDPLIGTAKNLGNSYSTMAHEFQHMVNLNCNKDQGGQMDTWLNEALSLAAEHLYEGVQSSRISYYNNSTAIADGRSVMDWTSSDSLPNYALSYLFSQYLSTQAEAKLEEGQNTDIYKQIITDPGNANTALTNAIKANIDTDMTIEKFMTNFRVAMVLKASNGSYSFGKDAASFSGITTKLSIQTSVDLKGGGAIVKGISGSFTAPDVHGDNISYTGIY